MKMFVKRFVLITFTIGILALLLIPLVKTHADEYWYSDEVDRIKKIPKPEEALNSKINIKDGFNVPGQRQEYATSDKDDWIMYYNGNSTYKVANQQNMAMMYNDSWIGQKGMMWYNRPVNLNYSFEVESYFLVQAKYLQNASGFYGASNGIAFVLQNDPAGRNAIGGRSGGMGVYPTAPNTVNMIYNALAVEFDTANNFSTVVNGAGHDKKLNKAITTPHMAIGTTYVPSKFVSHQEDTKAVINNFTHDALLTPTTPGVTIGSGNPIGGSGSNLIHTEGDSWFNQWVKVTTRWEPVLNAGIEEGDSKNIKNGRLSYQLGPITNQTTGEIYTYPLQTSEPVDIDKTFNSRFSNPKWDRTVYWGYTGAGQSSNAGTMFSDIDHFVELKGRRSPGAVMVNKLPFEADVDVVRQVKNITAAETNYQKKTTAHVGDIIEYKVDVTNKVMAQSNLPFTKFKLQEDLQANEYIDKSFKLTSTSHTGPVARIDTSGGNNLFTVGLDSYNVDEDEIANYTYHTSTGFSYTYRVKIGEDTQIFNNDINMTSAYTSEANYGETSVVVYPKGEAITKSLTNQKNPIVGEAVDVQLDLSVSEGVLKLNDIRDSVPSGFDVKSGSTKLDLLDKNNVVINTLNLNDLDVWSEGDLNINMTNVPALNDFLLKGGIANQRIVRVSYTIVPKEEIKGKIINLPNASASGTSINDGFNTVINYQFVDATSNNIKVKTDATILFKKKSDNSLISASKIISSDTTFNNTNPVVIYMNTGDSYDYASIIEEVSVNLLTNDKLHQEEVIGDSVSSGILETGSLINVLYAEEVNMTISQVYQENNTVGIYDDLVNKKKIDNSKKFVLKQGDNIEDILKNLTTKEQFKLNHQGYKELELDDYQIMIKGNPIESEVVPNEDFTLLFEYEGLISFDERPNIDFGQVKIDNGSDQTYSPVNDDTEVKIINTTLTEDWKLFLSLPEGFKGASKEEYLGDITYNDKNKKQYVIGKTNQMIEKQMTNELIQTIDMKGDSSKNGLVINQDIGNRKEKFSGKLLWSLEDIPEN